MFIQPRSSNRRRNKALLVSFVLHCIVLYVLVRSPRPVYVTPSSVAFGHGGSSTELVYLTAIGSAPAHDSSPKAQHKRLTLNTRGRAAQQAEPQVAAEQTTPQAAAGQAARAGTPYGSFAEGLATGHDVRPALPMVFPDPAILPWQIPAGVQGTVIVEVTIDVEGNVTETRVLQGLGHGIEDKVVAALRGWRFRPATFDGRAIPSQQDVYFHFPS